MRKLFLSILLASAAASPALADPPTREDRQQAREDRKQAREERQQARENARSERPQVNRVERVQPQMNVQPQVNVQKQMQARQQPVDRTPRAQAFERRAGNIDTARERIDARRQAQDNLRDQRAQERARFQQQRMASPAPRISNVPRPGTQPPPRVDNRRDHAPRWSSNWRHNNKYDWYNYRHRHRSLFHLGFYYDPFGWGYQPYSIGWRMWPSYYSSRYWISDPWQYRLPYAPAGYQWIRYWNDAILVDTWTGEVVDVIPNFFW